MRDIILPLRMLLVATANAFDYCHIMHPLQKSIIYVNMIVPHVDATWFFILNFVE